MKWPNKGIIYAILAALIGLFGSTLLAYNTQAHDVVVIAMIWYAASVSINTGYLLATRTLTKDFKEVFEHLRPMSLLIGAGILEGASWFYVFNLIGLSGTAITYRLSLVLITIYSIYVLKETNDKTEKVCMYIICAASLCLFFDIESNIGTWDYIVAFGAAIISFLYTIGLKNVSQKAAPTAVHFFRAIGIFSIYAISHTTIYGSPAPDLTEFTTIALISIAVGGMCCGFINQFFRFRSFQLHCPLYIYKTITAAIPALSFLIGVLLIGEPSSTLKWSVATIVLAASGAITYRQYINSKKAKTTP